MKFSKKILSQTVTQLCLSNAIDHIVLSPGSRNAPLTIGFTQHPGFKNFSIVDERCAAFFALGMAQQLRRPVALVCTSGSALLNYYPAIAEAFYSDIPLVVISADRPEQLIDVGDGQTIRQENVFENHILYSANCREGHAHFSFNAAEILKALTTAVEQKGPVHINIPFSEPLYEMVDVLDARLTTDLMRSIPDPTIVNIDGAAKEAFVTKWNNAKRKMVLVGVLPPNSIAQKHIELLAQDESVVVLTETTSNLHHPNFFPAIDQLIAPFSTDAKQELQPELLLTFGGMIVSKKIKALLRDYSPKSHYHVDSKKGYDTFFSLTHLFKVDVNSFLNSLNTDIKKVTSSYRTTFLNIKKHRLTQHKSYLDRIMYSDFMVFSSLFQSLPKNVHLQLANSATIRYAQLYDLDKSIHTFCNRGTSGIDGSTSTAIGAACIQDRQTIFVTGDLSFFYDSNALWNNYIPTNFRIVIVNNSGGGIFRILPGAKDVTHFDEFFETKHNLSAASLANEFGFEYSKAESMETMAMALESFYTESDTPKILEIFTPSQLNDKVLIDYFKYIA